MTYKHDDALCYTEKSENPGKRDQQGVQNKAAAVKKISRLPIVTGLFLIEL